MKTPWLMVAALTIICGCSNKSVSVQELALWVRDPSHGLVETVDTGPYVISVQYLPAAFLRAVANERHRPDVHTEVRQAELSVFELSIRSTKSNSTDAAFSGISTLDEFTARMQSLAFTMNNDVKLHLTSRTIDCLSASLQQDIGLRLERSVRLVFAVTEDELASSQVVEVQWSDKQYATGKSIFRCDLSCLARMPMARIPAAQNETSM